MVINMRMSKDFSEEYKNLGRNIAYYRKKAYLNQEGLAMRANISRGYLSQIEAENTEKYPSLDVVFCIADSLNIPVYLLFVHREQDS